MRTNQPTTTQYALKVTHVNRYWLENDDDNIVVNLRHIEEQLSKHHIRKENIIFQTCLLDKRRNVSYL